VDTFVVRIWTDDAVARGDRADGDGAELRGIVRHVQSGAEHRFATVAELLSRLRADAGEVRAGPDPADPAGSSVEQSR
jgi:hypothetical protein